MRILIAGFGGQGVLFVGKVLANIGMIVGKEVTWLPSYGPEMRGGTANCGVVLSDDPIGSPLVNKPDALLPMNNPSLAKFERTVVPGGLIIPDSTLVTDAPIRDDVKITPVPATALADRHDLKGFANMIVLGRLLKETALCTQAQLEEAMKQSIPARKQDLLAPNLKALALGLE